LHAASLAVSTVSASFGPTWSELTEKPLTSDKPAATRLVGVQ
jgi:hypothetical protein